MLLEDIGAEIGLFFALGGVLLAHFTDEPRWDALGSIAIGVLLVVIAILLAVEMKGLLIGESASTDDAERITATLEGAPSVRRLIHLKTQHLGPDELLVAAKLEFDPDLSVDELAEAINGAETGAAGRGPDRPRRLHRAGRLPPGRSEFVTSAAPTPDAGPDRRRHRLRARRGPRLLEQLVDRQVGGRARLGGRVLADDRRGRRCGGS